MAAAAVAATAKKKVPAASAQVQMMTTPQSVHIIGRVGDELSLLAPFLEAIPAAATLAASPVHAAVSGGYHVLRNKAAYVVNFFHLPANTRLSIRIAQQKVAAAIQSAPDEEPRFKNALANFAPIPATTKPSPFSGGADGDAPPLFDPTFFMLHEQGEPFDDVGLVEEFLVPCPLKADYLLLIAPMWQQQQQQQRGQQQLLLCLEPSFLRAIFRMALFLLPHDDEPIWIMPNPAKRFCITLRDDETTSRSSNAESNASSRADRLKKTWLQSRKVKRALKSSSTFELVVTSSFGEALRHAAELHEGMHSSTWISPSFCVALERLVADSDATRKKTSSDGSTDLHLMSFQLFRVQKGSDEVTTATDSETRKDDGDDDENGNDYIQPSRNGAEQRTLLAATFGFRIGCVFHDYTMATFDRSSSRDSHGSLLTKMVGFALASAGIQLWYWGLKSPGACTYMGEFEEHGYGGCELDRKEFFAQWRKYTQQPMSSAKFSEGITKACAVLSMPLQIRL